jgi:hypothetical protein
VACHFVISRTRRPEDIADAIVARPGVSGAPGPASKVPDITSEKPSAP